MLFLLRKIRHKLMQKNKITDYLLYAMGEIVLVVIGILIALSLNNWNEDRKTKKIEIRYLKEIRANLLFDLNDLDFNIQFNEERFRATKIVLNHLRNQLPYHDSLDVHLSNIALATLSRPNSSAFQSVSTKGIEIISNDSLRAKISKLYTFEYGYLMDFERHDDHPHQFSVIWPEIIEALEIDSLTRAARPIDYKDLVSNIPFRNMLTSNLTIRGHMVGVYRRTKKMVTELIDEIDHELERLE
jgi:hypothetical protein